jgi:hypothetical protein
MRASGGRLSRMSDRTYCSKHLKDTSTQPKVVMARVVTQWNDCLPVSRLSYSASSERKLLTYCMS